MKKILIVNNNLIIGGIQKALVSFIEAICDDYEVSLLLFRKEGALIDQIPTNVKIIETTSAYKYLGKRQAMWSLCGKIKRGILVVLTRIFGFKATVPIMNATIKKGELTQEYDLAISYMQNSERRVFYGGVANYVLSKKVRAKRKACFIHCDYLQSGTAYPYNNELYRKFNKIVCVSDSVKHRFDKVLPDMSAKTIGMYNAVNANKIREFSMMKSYKYDKNYINYISVARLSPEKGLERAIRAFSKIETNTLRYYIVGDGNLRSELEKLINELKLNERVFLLGETDNPYRYMIGADWLLVPSYHEAAPVVFQEAVVLGLPILTTNTASAQEMIGERYGLVVDNSDDGLIKGIKKTVDSLQEYRALSKTFEYDTASFKEQFLKLFE